jgi:molybdopterin/thiamine biosynthesis adenylyltransferase
MNTIRITKNQYEDLRSNLLRHAPKEAAAFALGGVFKTSDGWHFTFREVMYPQPSDYKVQGEARLEVSPVFLNRVISKAEREELTIASCHSHPFSTKSVTYSPSDDYGERASAKTIYECLKEKQMGSLLFGKDTVIGRIWTSPEREPLPFDQIRIIDRRAIFKNIKDKQDYLSKLQEKIYARQIFAFGKSGQAFLSSLVIGIVGLGGTGSNIAEQLARLGVSRFILVDHDILEPSNRTRVYGSYPKRSFEFWRSENESKVSIAKRNIQRIQPNARVETLPHSIINQKILSKLKGCDLIFSCVDRQAPRSVLNELSYQYYIPTIDLGVGLDVAKDRVTGGSARVTLLAPGLPCLFCYGVIRPDVISAEFLDKNERAKRLREGYIPGLTDAPSVINFTTTVAGIAVSLMLDMFFGFSESKTNNIIFDFKNLSASRLLAGEVSVCTCKERMGYSDYKSLSAPTE